MLPIFQTVFRRSVCPVDVDVYQLDAEDFTPEVVKGFVASAKTSFGVAATYDDTQKVVMFAIATAERVLVVTTKNVSLQEKEKSVVNELERRIFRSPKLPTVAFRMDFLAASLSIFPRIRISRGIQLLPITSDPYGELVEMLEEAASIDLPSLEQIFEPTDDEATAIYRLALEAWVAWRLYLSSQGRFKHIPLVKTAKISQPDLALVKTIVREYRNLDALKDQNDGAYEKQAAPRSVSLNSLGRQGSTHAELAKAKVVLEILQREIDLNECPFVQKLWGLCKKPAWSKAPPLPPTPSSLIEAEHLDEQQRLSAQAILSNEDSARVVTVAGRPGTGKTEVLTACAANICGVLSGTCWIVCATNNAVLSTAESLARKGFLDFTVLNANNGPAPRRDGRVADRTLWIDDLTQDDAEEGTSRPEVSNVVLCTLAALSNPAIAALTDGVPIQYLFIEEANQININDCLPVLVRHKDTLAKLVFFGDHKMFAPFGYKVVPGVSSVLKNCGPPGAYFRLSEQYRLPARLWAFVRKQFYREVLNSDTATDQPSELDISSCRFVDIRTRPDANEGFQASIKAYKELETETIADLAKRFARECKSFSVIALNEERRKDIQRALSSMGKWHNRQVFTIDSFQGKEDDFIIVSLGTHSKLFDNVGRVVPLLTRSREGLVLCTDRAFVEQRLARATGNPGRWVAVLAEELGPKCWVDRSDVSVMGQGLFD